MVLVKTIRMNKKPIGSKINFCLVILYICAWQRMKQDDSIQPNNIFFQVGDFIFDYDQSSLLNKLVISCRQTFLCDYFRTESNDKNLLYKKVVEYDDTTEK